MTNANFFYAHRKEVYAFGKGKGKDVDTICLMYLADKGLDQNQYKDQLVEFTAEWRKHLKVSGEEAARFFRGEID